MLEKRRGKEFSGRFIDGEQLLTLRRDSLGALIFRDLDAHALSQLFNGLDEAQLFIIGHEGDYVSGFSAGEALIDLFGLANVKRGLGVIMEGANTPPIRTHVLQREITLNYLHDVIGLSDLIY